ncbi:DUF4097 family beta strand repeat protein [Nocardia puris]|uniref:Putative adhesin n=1 Tax=Nocardia puris TaxID=208602 RepID=A0A366DCU5_9NOCA|nr:DUF4097 family beta strand repeat-containing protein [Nocardia puris]MBF6211139.1 DUF4097 family beta strand repeat protein [Nocardia puris]MBF6364858.1 DUF4097 family beta strand repeat protein [Nocardia puris]MBF6458644.1 DUF4097 family beta strand repeat protein [Nocardia puris]RBO87856.1 putative adhesin [Nocardia puris]
MPEFDTPEPISVVVDTYVGDVRIIAGDRDTTVVDVRPVSKDRFDVEAADQTRVDYSAGLLRVLTPRPPVWKQAIIFGRKHGSVEVVIEVPSGSQIQADTDMGNIQTRGTLGECRLESGFGDIQVDAADALELNSGMGSIVVERARGMLRAHTSSGEVRIRHIDGSAEIDSANGAATIDEVTGELRVKSANGDITVGTAKSGVTAKTAAGAIRIGEVTRGLVTLESAAGRLDVGIRQGTAVLLDLHTKFGSVRNELDTAAGPEPSDEKAEVRARTSAGDIIVRRSA